MTHSPADADFATQMLADAALPPQLRAPLAAWLAAQSDRIDEMQQLRRAADDAHARYLERRDLIHAWVERARAAGFGSVSDALADVELRHRAASLESDAVAPVGWVRTPTMPTPGMIDAGRDASDPHGMAPSENDGTPAWLVRVYRAMLAAVPADTFPPPPPPLGCVVVRARDTVTHKHPALGTGVFFLREAAVPPESLHGSPRRTGVAWSSAPPWAAWAATDSDSCRWFFSELPERGSTRWYANDGSLHEPQPTADWEGTLEPRPLDVP